MPVQTIKLVLALAGVLVYLAGARSGQDLLRWTGIALVAVAWLLRFVGRRSAPDRFPTSPSED